MTHKTKGKEVLQHWEETGVIKKTKGDKGGVPPLRAIERKKKKKSFAVTERDAGKQGEREKKAGGKTHHQKKNPSVTLTLENRRDSNGRKKKERKKQLKRKPRPTGKKTPPRRWGGESRLCGKKRFRTEKLGGGGDESNIKPHGLARAYDLLSCSAG